MPRDLPALGAMMALRKQDEVDAQNELHQQRRQRLEHALREFAGFYGVSETSEWVHVVLDVLACERAELMDRR